MRSAIQGTHHFIRDQCEFEKDINACPVFQWVNKDPKSEAHNRQGFQSIPLRSFHVSLMPDIETNSHMVNDAVPQNTFTNNLT